MGVREAREGREGIWTPAKARSSAKHTVQECQQTPSHPALDQREGREKKGKQTRERLRGNTFQNAANQIQTINWRDYVRVREKGRSCR